MRHGNRPSERSQVESLLRQFAQAPGLPFADVLDHHLVHHILNHGGVGGRSDAIYTPAVTLALFVGQAIDPDPSLRQAVARLLAERQAQGLSACSGETGAYAMARQRLPENVLAVLARSVGANLLCDACPSWSWRGRDVKIIDGSTLSMPDTPANQAVYPQSPAQQPGVGFPIMRVVALFSLAVGTVLAAAYGPYQGKETGETALLRSLHHHLDEKDVVLADRYFCSYFEIALLGQRGVDAVFRLHQCRHADFRAGQCLASGDRLVTWCKPQRPVWLDEATYRQLPDQLTLRMLRIHVPKHIRNVRSRCIDLVTTLLDPQAFPKKALAELFWLRWHAELDLRSLKCVLQMDVLRGKSPEMVQKELWAHLLAYNLIRKVMAQAAATHNVPPRQLSFKGAVQTLLAFAATLLRCSHSKFVEHTVALFAAIVSHRVGDRPGRLEPRRKKRRPKPYPLLRIPRRDARRLELV